MGEYADYELARLSRSGYGGKFTPVERFAPLQCPFCGGVYGGAGLRIGDGLKQHMQSKHGMLSRDERELGLRHAVAKAEGRE